MTLFILSIILGVILVSSIAGYRQEKSNEEYGKYLLKLDEVKQRKRDRNS